MNVCVRIPITHEDDGNDHDDVKKGMCVWTSDPTPIIAQLMDLDKRGNIMTIMIFVIIYVEPRLRE